MKKIILSALGAGALVAALLLTTGAGPVFPPWSPAWVSNMSYQVVVAYGGYPTSGATPTVVTGIVIAVGGTISTNLVKGLQTGSDNLTNQSAGDGRAFTNIASIAVENGLSNQIASTKYYLLGTHTGLGVTLHSDLEYEIDGGGAGSFSKPVAFTGGVTNTGAFRVVGNSTTTGTNTAAQFVGGGIGLTGVPHQTGDNTTNLTIFEPDTGYYFGWIPGQNGDWIMTGAGGTGLTFNGGGLQFDFALAPTWQSTNEAASKYYVDQAIAGVEGGSATNAIGTQNGFGTNTTIVTAKSIETTNLTVRGTFTVAELDAATVIITNGVTNVTVVASPSVEVTNLTLRGTFTGVMDNTNLPATLTANSTGAARLATNVVASISVTNSPLITVTNLDVQTRLRVYSGGAEIFEVNAGTATFYAPITLSNTVLAEGCYLTGGGSGLTNIPGTGVLLAADINGGIKFSTNGNQIIIAPGVLAYSNLPPVQAGSQVLTNVSNGLAAYTRGITHTNYTAVVASDQVLFCTGTNQVITMPTPTNNTGKYFIFVVSTTTGSIIVTNTTATGYTVKGSTTGITVGATNTVGLISDGANWW